MRNFTPYSFSHCIVLSLTIVALCLVFVIARKINKGSAMDKGIRYLSAFSLLIFELLFLIMRIKIEPNKGYLLPLELCTISLYSISFLLFSYNTKLFRIVIFWAMVGSFLSLFFPMLAIPFPDFRFLHYFVTHAIIFVMAHYLFMVEGVGLHFKDAFLAWVTHFSMLIIVLPVNLICNTNFMFIMKQPGVFSFFFSWSGPIQPVLWVLFAILMYHVVYGYIILLTKIRTLVVYNRE